MKQEYRIKEKNGKFIPQYRKWRFWHNIWEDADPGWGTYVKVKFNDVNKAKDYLERLMSYDRLH